MLESFVLLLMNGLRVLKTLPWLDLSSSDLANQNDITIFLLSRVAIFVYFLFEFQILGCSVVRKLNGVFCLVRYRLSPS